MSAPFFRSSGETTGLVMVSTASFGSIVVGLAADVAPQEKAAMLWKENRAVDEVVFWQKLAQRPARQVSGCI
jgi:hypothetical protein